MKKRDITIDILKTIGILLIILAHSYPNEKLSQIRSFDVPLLVIISGMLGVNSYNKNKNGIKYLYKRILRLVVPVWLFLIFFLYLRL